MLSNCLTIPKNRSGRAIRCRVGGRLARRSILVSALLAPSFRRGVALSEILKLDKNMHEYLPFALPWLSRLVLVAALTALAQQAQLKAATPKIISQWDFDQGDLRATIGKDLQYGDGPTGRVKAHTSFGTTTSFGIPDIGGQPAKVMKYTRDDFSDTTDKNPRGYVCEHGIAPNGGGAMVNQFSMIMDILVPDLHMGDAYTAVAKWEAVDDFTVDASISIKGNDIGGTNTGGIGISGQYTGDGVTWIKGGQWQRVIVAVDMAADPGTIDFYIDGVKFGQMTSGDRWGLDQRHALSSIIRLFADGENDNEVNTFYVNSIQFRDGTVNAKEAAVVGAASAAGIPHPITARVPQKVTGQWDFDNGDLRATLGTDMQYGDGPTGRMKDHTSFGTTTSFGIPDIGGKPAKVMKYTRDEFDGVADKNPRGYLTYHGMAPNGGGNKVNQFTMIVDFMIPDLHMGDNYNTVVKWEAVDDFTVDGSISIKANDIGGDNTGGIGISGQYTGDGVTWIIGGQWQRLIVAVDMTVDPGTIDYYLDGVKFGQMTSGDRWGFDERHAIPPAVRMYGDGENDDEVNTVYVNSLQFREGAMTAADATALGAATADGIPAPAASIQPKLAVAVSGHNLTLSWDATATGFVLENTGSLSTPNWSAVPGVANSSVTVKTDTGSAYYRLKKAQ
jgi:hypothetical protein